MDEQKKINLQKMAQEGLALEELKNHQGYTELVKIFRNLYDESLILLIDKENESARSTINSLQNIVSKIDDRINLGKDAREQLSNDLLEKHQI